MSTTVATNIRLPEDTLKTLKYKAIEEKKSVNQLIREAIEMLLTTTVQSKKYVSDPFDDIIGIVKSGIKDGSTRHDRYLYGKRR